MEIAFDEDTGEVLFDTASGGIKEGCCVEMSASNCTGCTAGTTPKYVTVVFSGIEACEICTRLPNQDWGVESKDHTIPAPNGAYVLTQSTGTNKCLFTGAFPTNGYYNKYVGSVTCNINNRTVHTLITSFTINASLGSGQIAVSISTPLAIFNGADVKDSNCVNGTVYNNSVTACVYPSNFPYSAQPDFWGGQAVVFDGVC